MLETSGVCSGSCVTRQTTGRCGSLNVALLNIDLHLNRVEPLLHAAIEWSCCIMSQWARNAVPARQTTAYTNEDNRQDRLARIDIESKLGAQYQPLRLRILDLQRLRNQTAELGRN